MSICIDLRKCELENVSLISGGLVGWVGGFHLESTMLFGV